MICWPQVGWKDELDGRASIDSVLELEGVRVPDALAWTCWAMMRRSYSRPRRRTASIATTMKKTPMTVKANATLVRGCHCDEMKQASATSAERPAGHEPIVYQF